jgi:hypothetical protein
MHHVMLRQLAADHTRELVTAAGDARRAGEARRGGRRRPPAHVRRSTRLYAQQREPRPGAGIRASSASGDRVDSSR